MGRTLSIEERASLEAVRAVLNAERVALQGSPIGLLWADLADELRAFDSARFGASGVVR
jgi:hypothetical protein